MYEFFVGLSIAALLFFSPLIYGGITILPLSIIESACFALIFIIVVRRFISKENVSFPKAPVTFLLVFICLVILQITPLWFGAVSSVSPATSVIYNNFATPDLKVITLSICTESTVSALLQLLSFLAVFFAVMDYADTLNKQRLMVLCIITCGIMLSLFGIIHKAYAYGVSFSTFTNRNHFAAYIEMVLPLCVAYSFMEMNKTKRLLVIFSAGVMIVALFLSMSRAARICSPLGLIIFFFMVYRRIPAKKIINTFLALSAFVTIFFSSIGLVTLMKRMETILSPTSAFSGRFETVRDSLPMIKDFFLFGTGLGTFGDIFQKYKTFESGLFIRFAHNDPIQILAETGVIGFLAISIFILFYCIHVYRIWLTRRSPFPVYIVLGCLVGVLTVSLHSFVEFVFKVPAISLLLFVLLALAYGAVHTKEGHSISTLPRIKMNLPGWARVLCIILFCVIFAQIEWLIYRRYAAETLFESVRNEKFIDVGISMSMRYDDAIKKIDRAISLNPINASYWNKKGDLLTMMSLPAKSDKESPESIDPVKYGGILKRARACYLKAIDLNPTNSEYHLHIGWLYHATGEYDMAKDEFKKAVLLDPMNKKMLDYISTYNTPQTGR